MDRDLYCLKTNANIARLRALLSYGCTPIHPVTGEKQKVFTSVLVHKNSAIKLLQKRAIRHTSLAPRENKRYRGNSVYHTASTGGAFAEGPKSRRSDFDIWRYSHIHVRTQLDTGG